MAHLVLVRHGKSEWNELGLWTGWNDVELHADGKHDAEKMAEHLKDIEIHLAHTSKLKRAKDTAAIILESLNLAHIPVHEHEALNERHYGIHQGKNKWQVKEEVGEEEFQNIRRGWDHVVEGGETLKQVHDRAVPYFEEHILPQLKLGKNVLVAAHGNSLRALTKYLCKLSDEEVCNLEIGIGEVHVYEFDNEGNILKSEIRGLNPNKGKI
ncbi:MAG TPA: 2,3-diphosphoglycerate-dependent phosphoglycerate mutase [Alphaproteobacteria bacterium]|jgi:2,3-bisphosphoglycerate-dependent phosphoglycerate mutase|nr:2,3-diphosphoglycerate-dependent phosphoglycerate mutase [Alphaproteobacteria bacterium]